MHAGDHIGDELIAVNVESDGSPCGRGSRARRANTRPKREQTRSAAEQIRRQAGKQARHNRSARSFLQQRKPGERVARRDQVRPSSPP